MGSARAIGFRGVAFGVAGGMILAVDLRVELMPPPVSAGRLAGLCEEIDRIAELVLGRVEGAEEAITAFNAGTGHDYVAYHFAGYDGSRDLVDFALEAARPAWPKVEDIGTDELVEIVRRLLAGDPESEWFLRLLTANVAHPHVVSLVFDPPPELCDASAEQIVDAALHYRPIAI